MSTGSAHFGEGSPAISQWESRIPGALERGSRKDVMREEKVCSHSDQRTAQGSSDFIKANCLQRKIGGGFHSRLIEPEFGERGGGPSSIGNESKEKLVLDEGGSNLRTLATNNQGMFILDQQGLGKSKHFITRERTDTERTTDRIANFFEKVKEIGLDNGDHIARSIKQLGLLSLLPGFEKELIKDATSKLLTDIVTGDEGSRLVRSKKRQPSRLPKHIKDRYNKQQIQMDRAKEGGAINAEHTDTIDLPQANSAKHGKIKEDSPRIDKAGQPRNRQLGGRQTNAYQGPNHRGY